MLLEGIDPESEEPAEGEDERLSERIGALIAQRRRIRRCSTPACWRPDTAEEFTDEIDRRLALLADRLVCEPPEACDAAAGGPPAAPAP